MFGHKEYELFVLCCGLAKLEDIVITLDFLFFIGLLWPNKDHLKYL